MGGWVVGGGRGSCLFEDKNNIYISSLSARSKFAIALRVRVRVSDPRLTNHDPRPTTHDSPTHAD